MTRTRVFRASALVGVLGVAAILLLPGVSLALTKTMNVVATMPDGPHRVGDRVTLTSHVLNFGIPENASTIEVWFNRARVNERELEVRQIDTGVYESTFELLATDPSLRVVRVMVAASIGAINDFALLTFLVEDLAVDVTTTPSRAVPGGSVDVVVRVRDGTIAREADSLYVYATIVNTGGDPLSTEVPWLRLDTGMYLVTYYVPDALEQDTFISFLALVAAGTSTASGSSLLFVDLPTTLVVWSHGRTVESSSGVLEILVANETGWPVADALVAMRYAWSDGTPALQRRDVAGITDAAGVCVFNLTYPDAHGSIGFWGTVAAQLGIQRFEGSLSLPPSGSTRRLDIRRDDRLDPFASGESATLRYSVLTDGNPMPEQTIFFYAHTREDFVASGTVTTNATGQFDMTFLLPAGLTTIEFSSFVDDVWIYVDDVVFAARPLALTVGPIYVGSVTHLSAPVPLTGPYIAFITLLPFRPGLGMFEFPWGLANGPLGAYDVAVSHRGAIEHDLVLPRFLPKGQEYLLYVEAVPLAPASAEETYVYAETFTIENLAPTASATASAVRIGVGSTVTINASASSDLDGVIDAYEFAWGDGTTSDWITNATASHAYDRAGEFLITIRVRDDSAAVSVQVLEILVSAPTMTTPPPGQLAMAAALAVAAAAAIVLGARFLLRRSRSRSRETSAPDRASPADDSPVLEEAPPPPPS